VTLNTIKFMKAGEKVRKGKYNGRKREGGDEYIE
jgi:hypothetical protein